MAFDYKKEYKEFYLPPRTPGIVTVPAMNFLAVRGQGDPNEEHGAYKQALEQLYAVAYTIKMSKRNPPEGYFDYVVPPLEGLWWQEGVHGVDYARKADFQWISLIRLPEFVTKVVFDQAVREATEKKQRDFSQVEFFPWEEGLCVQCMHIGPYDDEPATAAAMEEYARAQGYGPDFSQGRFHHEIYLSDVRRCQPEKLKTVIRQPINGRSDERDGHDHSRNTPGGIYPFGGISLSGHLSPERRGAAAPVRGGSAGAAGLY